MTNEKIVVALQNKTLVGLCMTYASNSCHLGRVKGYETRNEHVHEYISHLELENKLILEELTNREPNRVSTNASEILKRA